MRCVIMAVEGHKIVKVAYHIKPTPSYIFFVEEILIR